MVDLDPATIANFGLAVTFGRFVSDVAFREYLERYKDAPDRDGAKRSLDDSRSESTERPNEVTI